MELRCPSRIQAILVEDNLLEFKCSSKHCGAGNGVVVLHYFDLSTGTPVLVRTKRFRDPMSLHPRTKE